MVLFSQGDIRSREPERCDCGELCVEITRIFQPLMTVFSHAESNHTASSGPTPLLPENKSDQVAPWILLWMTSINTEIFAARHFR